MKRAALLLAALIPAVAWGEDNDLPTNVYVVPPTFPQILAKMAQEQPVRSLEDSLSRIGIEFPEGASVIFNPATSQLIVRNTVEEMVKSQMGKVEKQVFVTIRECPMTDKQMENWSEQFFENLKPPVRPELRRGGPVRSRDDLLEALSAPPFPLPGKDPMVIKSGIAGVLTDPQFQLTIRALRQDGVDIIEAPSVMVRPGQPGLIQVGDARWAVVPLIDAKEKNLSMELFFPPHGEAMFQPGEARNPTVELVVPDSLTVVYAESRKDGKNRIIFVKCQIMDPAGMPINEGETPEEEEVVAPLDNKPASPDETDSLKQAEQLSREGQELLDLGKREAAAEKFKEAAETVPNRPLFAPWREAYLKQWNNALPNHADKINQLKEEEKTAIKKADETALTASISMADGDLSATVKGYTTAIELLPHHPICEPRRAAYEKQLKRAKEALK